MPEFDKLNSYADRGSLEKETLFILDKLKEIETQGLSTAKALKTIGIKVGDKSGSIAGKVKEMKDFAAATDVYAQKLAFVSKEEKKLADIQAAAAKARAAANTEKKKEIQLESELIKQKTLQDKAEQQNLRTKQQQITYEQALQNQKNKGLSQSASEMRLAEQLTNEYYQLGKALTDAEIKYKNLALTQGFEAKATKEALKSALDIRNVLDKVDGNLRNFQRNVGNYKSAFDGLGMSFTQVARELPSLTISAQQFFLAISNNLPAVFDEMKNARQEIEALKAAGQSAPSLASRVASSIFSWQVGVAVGITLLVAFGGKLLEAAKGLFGFAKANDDAAEATKRFLESQLSVIKILKELSELQKIPVGMVDELEKQLGVNQALNKSKGDQLALEKEIARIRAANAKLEFEKFAPDLMGANGFVMRGQQALDEYTRLLEAANSKFVTLIKEQAATKDKEDRDELQKEIDRAKVAVEYYKERVGEKKKAISDFYKSTAELEKKDAEILEYNRAQKILRETESAKIISEIIINANQRVLDDERNFEAKRIAALKAQAAERKKIIAQDARVVKEDPSSKNADGKYTAEALVALKKFAAERRKVDLDLQVSIFNVREEFRKRLLAAVKAQADVEFEQRIEFNKDIFSAEYNSLQERQDALTNYLREKQEQILTAANTERITKVMTEEEKVLLEKETAAKLNEVVKEGIQERSNIITTSSEKDVNFFLSVENRRLALQKLVNTKFIANRKKRDEVNKDQEYESQRKSLELQIAADEEILRNQQTTQEAKYKTEIELNAKMAALYKLDTDHFIEEQNRKIAALASFGDKMTDVFDTVAMLVERDQIIRKNALREEQDAAEKKAAREIELINASTLTEEEKAAKIAIITARANAQKEEFARRERDIELRKAKFEKARTLFTITLEIAKALAELNFFKAGIATAQLFIAAATPLPRYFKGKKKGEGVGGMAIVDDGGVPEAIQRPDGSIEIGGNKPRITYVGKDDIVHKNLDELQRSLELSALKDVARIANKPVHQNDYALLMIKSMERNAALEAENQRLLRNISEKPVQIIQGTDKGVEVLLAWASRRASYFQDNTNF